MTAGYSGTPLAKKLSLKDGTRVWWDGMPESVLGKIAAEELQLLLLSSPEAPIHTAHIFVTERADLEAKLTLLLPLLQPAGMIWVSWPKKASKVPTDIFFAMILTVLYGREIGNMLRFVASGPFPDAKDWGSAGAVLGLVVHFTLMAIMATIFVLAARRFPDLLRSPSKWGIAYGLITYAAMNWIVVPLRFDAPLPPKPMAIATQLFAHLVLVGIPFALITARTLRVSFMQHATI